MLQTRPKVFRNVSKCPKMSQNVPKGLDAQQCESFVTPEYGTFHAEKTVDSEV